MCSYCLMTTCPPCCPNYESKTDTYCDVCGEGIYDGEEYLENIYGECRHYECFQGMRDLLEWLGYEIKIKETSK